MPLTGRFDFRRTVSGKLLLLLEEDVAARWSPFRKGARRRRWRRARVLDLAAREMRPLMDLRSRPNFAILPERKDQPASAEHMESALEGALAGSREGGAGRHAAH